MKVLIVFNGKYGSTRMYAERLAEVFGDDSQAIDVKQVKKSDLDNSDNVIVGGGVYMGKTTRALKSFLKKHLNVLKNKKVGLFICCASKDEDSQITDYFDKNFPPELLKSSVFKRVLPGGQVINEKAGFIYKKVYEQMKKIPEEEIQLLISDTVNSFSF